MGLFCSAGVYYVSNTYSEFLNNAHGTSYHLLRFFFDTTPSQVKYQMTFPTPRIIVRLFAGQAMDALLQLTYCNLFTKKHEVFLAVPYGTTAISFEDAGRMQCVFYEPDLL